MSVSLHLAIVLLLWLVAWRDVAARLIPDGLNLFILLSGLLLRLTEGWASLAASLACAALLFLVLLLLAVRGFLGGGDVKLMAAVAAGLPPAAAGDFVMVTVVAGGLLGLAYLALTSRVPVPRPAHGLLRRVARVEARRMRRGGPLPYGVAIAVGASAVILASGS